MADDRVANRKAVLTRLPVDGTEEELDAWVESFLDALLGPEDDTSSP